MPALILSSVLLASAGAAQPGAVVQPIPPAAAVETLNNNLARLSRNPQDVDALLGAGQAALDLGDVQAANGFFTRANIVSPGTGRVKLGLAIVQLQLKQADDAAANFDAAEALGDHAVGHLADRGLAYDLTGQQAKAQRDYQAALRADPDDAAAKLRYAVSLGISGRLAEADKLIEPQLAGGDRETWRMRAFIYAMNGRQTEARSITQSVMPKGLADALEPYMVRVPLLSPGQKAAAAHFGDFPANVLRMAAPNTVPTPTPAPPAQIAQAEKRETANDGKKSKNKREKEPRNAARSEKLAEAATPTPTPTPTPTQVARALVPPPPAPMPSAAPTPTPTPAAARAAPIAPAAPTPSPTLSSRPALVPPPPPEPERSLANALSALKVPAAEKAASGPALGMDDLKRIQEEQAKKAAEDKAKAAAAAKAKAEAAAQKKLRDNPSRNFVQIAAGKKQGALAFDLNRFRKRYDAIGDEQGWTVRWGATNRLLIGPFRSESAAQDVVNKIKKDGGDAFIWQSEAGEVVARVDAK